MYDHDDFRALINTGPEKLGPMMCGGRSFSIEPGKVLIITPWGTSDHGDYRKAMSPDAVMQHLKSAWRFTGAQEYDLDGRGDTVEAITTYNRDVKIAGYAQYISSIDDQINDHNLSNEKRLNASKAAQGPHAGLKRLIVIRSALAKALVAEGETVFDAPDLALPEIDVKMLKTMTTRGGKPGALNLPAGRGGNVDPDAVGIAPKVRRTVVVPPGVSAQDSVIQPVSLDPQETAAPVEVEEEPPVDESIEDLDSGDFQ